MNVLHRLVCRSAPWRWFVLHRLLPWALDGLILGDHALELGPGPGLTTDALLRKADRLTAVEIDPRLASSLRERLKGMGVEVVLADATALPFPDGMFSAVLSFTMLHHVPSLALQDLLLAEAYRVLRPGGCSQGRTARRASCCGCLTWGILGFRSTLRHSLGGSRRPGSVRLRWRKA